MRVVSIFLLLSCLLAPAVGRAQMDAGGPAASPPQRVPGSEEQDRSLGSMQNRQRIELNKQRQEEIKRDADKLLQLATELKLSVDKSDANLLSLDVIKKATEIEKLAKTVREKMKAN